MHGLLLLVVFGTALLSGVFGMAGGIVLMGAFTALLPVSAAMVTHGLSQLVANGGRAIVHRAHIQWRVIGYYIAGSGSVALALALISLSPSKPWVYLALGLAPLLTWTPTSWAQLDAGKPPQAVLAGALVMGFNLVAGAAGPLLDIFFVRTALDRHAIVATKAATQSLSHVFKILFYGAPLLAMPPGQSGLPPWWFFALMVPVSIAGTLTGTQVLKRLSDAHFKGITRWILTVIGVVYLFTAFRLFTGQGA
ncbi:MAG: TSUP family transporter [Hyphomonadaceae bacterium]